MKDKKIIKVFIIFCLVFSTSLTYPKISQSNEQTIEKRLNEISNNVRCLVCRNQSIYDSNSDFANDIKKIIRIHLKDNKSDQFIYKFLSKHSISNHDLNLYFFKNISKEVAASSSALSEIVLKTTQGTFS